MKLTKTGARWFLAAMIDGEGSIGCYTNKDGVIKNRAIAIVNTDSHLLDFCEKCLEKLHIPFKRYEMSDNRSRNKKAWRIVIAGGKSSFQRVQQLIPIQSPEKVDRLMKLVNSYLT